MNKLLKYLGISVVTFAVAFMGLVSLVPVQKAEATTLPSFKVDICHATGSEQNPYNSQNVSALSVDGIGNGDHNRIGHQNGEDIIPPFYDDGTAGFWNSRNWNAEGQAIFYNDCEAPVVEPTPTPDPCDEEGLQIPSYVASESAEIDPCVTPTPTEEPTPTPVDNPQSSNDGGAVEAPVCSDKSTVNLPANVFVVRAGDKATVNGFITEGDSANIYWKESNVSSWQYSSAGTNPDGVKPNADKFVSYQIEGLKPGVDYDFGFQQKTGCGTGELVTAFVHDADDFTIVFRVSKYTVAQ